MKNSRAAILKICYSELEMALGLPPDHKIVASHQPYFEFKCDIICFKVVGPAMPEVTEGMIMEEMSLGEFHSKEIKGHE